MQLSSGEWLMLTAAKLAGEPDGPSLTAVTMSPAHPSELVRLMLRLHGLSAREREVAGLLHGGLSTDETAARLHISRHTLRDHVKSIFAKLDVRSRSEMTATLAGRGAHR